MHRSIRLTVLIVATVVASCRSTSVQVLPPVLSTLFPAQAVSTTSFVLTVSGNGFQSGARIVFNGRSMTTTFVNSGELTCTITPSDMAVRPSSSQAVAVPVSVSMPGASASNSLEFLITIYPTFQAAVRISDATTSQSDSLAPLIEIDPTGHLFVVWRDREDLRFARSVDAGAQWSTPATIHRSVARSYRFSMAFDQSGPTILVAWEEDSSIRAIHSSDAGQTWTPPAVLTDASTTAASNPGMFVDPSGTVFLAYLGNAPAGGAPYSVVILRSSNHGASFDEIGRVPWSTYFTGDTSPQLAADSNGTLSLVFTSEFGTRYATSYSSRSTDGGRTWSTPNRVSVVAPALAIDDQNALDIVGANMYLPYMYRIAFLRSTDQGASWTSHEFDGTNFAASSIFVNAFKSVDVVWAHQFARSFDRGSTWGPVVAYDEETEAARPSLVEDASGRIYIVWWDMNGGICFKASTPAQ